MSHRGWTAQSRSRCDGRRADVGHPGHGHRSGRRGEPGDHPGHGGAPAGHDNDADGAGQPAGSRSRHKDRPGAGPTGSKGSDTGEVSCVSGLSISLPPAVGCEISTGAGSRCRHGRTPSVIVAYPCLTSPASRRELPELAGQRLGDAPEACPSAQQRSACCGILGFGGALDAKAGSHFMPGSEPETQMLLPGGSSVMRRNPDIKQLGHRGLLQHQLAEASERLFWTASVARSFRRRDQCFR